MNEDFDHKRLVIATHNAGKMREFTAALSLYIKDIVSAATLNLPEPEETGVTFAENALLKARAAPRLPNDIALADDSGLCVNALQGQPGIYSARWGGPTRDFAMAMRRIDKELGDNPDRTAYFECVLALVWPDDHTELFEGRVHGHLVWPPRGDQGHGYDPIFVPQGHDKTFAEMSLEEKNALSHRGIALHKLVARFRRE
jgi:XTP/dITP diphosphohydrolase